MGLLAAMAAIMSDTEPEEWPFRYHIPASETEEGKERVRAYDEALGRLTLCTAETEAVVQRALWHYAGTPSPVARAIFSGTRTAVGFSFIRRICEADGGLASRLRS